MAEVPKTMVVDLKVSKESLEKMTEALQILHKLQLTMAEALQEAFEAIKGLEDLVPDDS